MSPVTEPNTVIEEQSEVCEKHVPASCSEKLDATPCTEMAIMSPGSRKRDAPPLGQVVEALKPMMSIVRPTVVCLAIVIELCAGSAILSFHLKGRGMQAIPVDHARNTHRSLLPTVKIDLADWNACLIVVSVIDSGNVEVIWSAVPCGTCSRAREIPLASGKPGPPPLRNAAFVRGIPGLSAINQLRVDKANLIYDNNIAIFRAASRHQCLMAVENPGNSWLWKFPDYDALLKIGFEDTLMQNCKWTANDTPCRAKWSRLRTNIPGMTQLAGPCGQKHVHLPWGQDVSGKFRTADEAEYPEGMCIAVADVIIQALKSKGIQGLGILEDIVLSDAPAHKKRRAMAGKQPRGKKLPPVVSEFREIVVMTRQQAENSGGKVLRQHVERGDSRVDEHCLDPDKVVVGVFRTPEEFLEAAKGVDHPTDVQGPVPDEILRAITSMVSKSPDSVIKGMLQALRELTKLAADCKKDDDAIIAALKPKDRKVMQGKKFATLQKLATQIAHQDSEIVNELVAGFHMTGMAKYSGIFEHQVTVPTMTQETLRSTSRIQNDALMLKVRSCGDSEVDQNVWEQNMEEQARGWLTGPYDNLEQLRVAIEDEPHVCRRFPLVQGKKIRGVDDLGENNVNEAYGSHDKLWLMDVDSISSTIRILERIVGENLEHVTMSSGDCEPVCIHPAWMVRSSAGLRLMDEWVGRTVDLKHFYKQFCTAQDSRWATCIACYDPVKARPVLFEQVTVPFGSAAAVLACNRAARLVWHIGCKLLGVVWHNFYDDFPNLCPRVISISTRRAIELMLGILGWPYSDDPVKDPPFAALFVALGVQFDISKLPRRASTVGNKQTRVDQVTAQLVEVREKRVMEKVLAQSLRGKLQYMEQQVFGKAGRAALRVFDRRLGGNRAVDDDELIHIEWLIKWLGDSRPRRLSPAVRGKPVLLFTDGACEYVRAERVVTCGALLFDPADDTTHIFGCRINETLCNEWAADGRQQLVTEAELLPCLLARRIWAKRLKHRCVLNFLDSEPAKFSFIRGVSDTVSCDLIVQAVHSEESQLQTYSWYTRVPTKSNPADDPSRLLIEETRLKYGAIVYTVPQPSTLAKGFWDGSEEGERGDRPTVL